MTTYSVLLYSVTSPICKKLFSYMNQDQLKSFHLVNTDYPETRKKIIRAGIKEVPCFIICFQDDYTVERYEGILALKWYLRVYLPEYRKYIVKQQERTMIKQEEEYKNDVEEENTKEEKFSPLLLANHDENVELESMINQNKPGKKVSPDLIRYSSTNNVKVNKGEGHEKMLNSSLKGNEDFTQMNSEIKTPKKIDINQVKSMAIQEREELSDKNGNTPKMSNEIINKNPLQMDGIELLTDIDELIQQPDKPKKTKSKKKKITT